MILSSNADGEHIGMINKRCPNPDCGSNNTYAVPSRAQIKTDESGKVIFDERTGEPVKLMCRRCRNCGRDYMDDGSFKPKAPSSDSEIGRAVRKIASERGIKIQ
jgi:hypothetical protein